MKSYSHKGTAGSWLGHMLGEMLDRLTTDVGAPLNVKHPSEQFSRP